MISPFTRFAEKPILILLAVNILAGLFLFRGPIGVDPVVLLPTAVVAGAGSVALGRIAWRSRRLAGSTGVEAIVGGRATVRSIEGDEALLVLQGSWWTERAVHGTLPSTATA